MTADCYSIDTANVRGDGGVPVFRSIENPSVPLSQAAYLSDGVEASSGVRVSRKSALAYDAVWRAVNLISTTVAKLPLIIHRRVGDGKVRATEHPAYRLLKNDPNPESTSFIFRQTMQGHVLLEGNAYAYIWREQSGKPTKLLLMDPDATYPIKINGVLWYMTTVDGELVKIHPDNVLHIKGLGFDGLCGYSVLSMARESLGLGLAARKFGSTFFKNGAKSSGILMYPGRLKETAIANLRREWERHHAGTDNQHKLAILEEGVTYQPQTIPPNDAQFLETRSFSRVEVANWFSVPPHKLGDASKSSYNSLEQENQAWIDDGLDGCLCNWEGESRKKLLTEREKETDSHVVEFLREALLRANLAARGSYYRTAISGGWMNVDEARSRENMNPLPNGEGQKFFRPLNMAVVGEEEPADEPEPEPEPETESDDDKRTAAIDALFSGD